jgi:hypothetical protein
MATYYKYAERSADSQINWAEVGKDMSDMLKEETRIREEKKAAINAASREYGQVLANSPQGEHEPARQAALKFADNASKYMLMQDKLLKSGQMSLKDYTISRQNLLDGTDNAFTALKDYQSVFAKKMERSRTSKSSLYELRKMEQAEGFGNFSQTEFYINPTNGSVNVAKKTKKVIDGKEVYTMDDKPGEFASINYVKGLINGEWDKFDSNAVTDAFAKGLGEELKATQTKIAEFSKTGEIKTVSDITSRTDIDPLTKKEIFSFMNAENQMIDAALANPFNRASVLTDNNVSASNGKLYDITTDPAKAKANPNLILEVIDPATGMGTLQFTPEQTKISQEFMRNQVRAKYDYKEETKILPQLERNEPRAPTGGEIEERNKIADAKNFAENMATALTGKDPVAIGNAIKYLANKSGKMVDRTATGIVIKNSDGTNVSTYNFLENGKVTDPKKLTKAMVSAFGTALPEDKIVQFANQFIGSNQLETKTKAAGFNVAPKPVVVDPMTVYGKHIDTVISDADVAGLSKGEAADALNAKLSGLGVTVKSSNNPFTDNVYVVSGKNKSPDFDVTKAGTVEAIKKWVKANPSGETPIQKAANIKALVKSGVITSGAGELDD